MLRLCSDSSRSYPGRSAPLCISQERRGAVKVAVMEQKSAEAIVDKDSTTHGGVVAGNEPGQPGWSHPVEGPNLKRGMSSSMSFHGTLNPTGLLPMERVIRNSAPQDNHSYCRLFKELGLEMTG